MTIPLTIGGGGGGGRLFQPLYLILLFPTIFLKVFQTISNFVIFSGLFKSSRAVLIPQIERDIRHGIGFLREHVPEGQPQRYDTLTILRRRLEGRPYQCPVVYPEGGSARFTPHVSEPDTRRLE